jgi:hypothetical protein
MTEELCSYGMSRSGVELTDEVTELMAVEAEAGLLSATVFEDQVPA